jgi:hypothetical protein
MVNDGAPADVDVVARVLGGDGEAFGILIRRYEPGLLRFATRMLGICHNAGIRGGCGAGCTGLRGIAAAAIWLDGTRTISR